MYLNGTTEIELQTPEHIVYSAAETAGEPVATVGVTSAPVQVQSQTQEQAQAQAQSLQTLQAEIQAMQQTADERLATIQSLQGELHRWEFKNRQKTIDECDRSTRNRVLREVKQHMGETNQELSHANTGLQHVCSIMQTQTPGTRKYEISFQCKRFIHYIMIMKSFLPVYHPIYNSNADCIPAWPRWVSAIN